ILAGNGNDTIDSGNGNDYIDSGSGNDEIYAGDGDDTLIGGKGNDTLQGGMGSDTYVFGRDFGKDTIINYNPDNSKDTIKFIDGIVKDDISFKREANNLILTLKDDNQTSDDLLNNNSSSNSITLIDFFRKTRSYLDNAITSIEFSDNEELSLKDITNILAISSDDNSNTIEALTNDSYTIDAKGGDDFIKTGSGNDILIGGKGDDTLNGGLGNDTYKFDDDFGKDIIINYNPNFKDIDIIEFMGSINKDDISFVETNGDLVIYLKDELNSYLSKNQDLKNQTLTDILSNLTNTITIKDFYKLDYNGYSNNAITTIKFKDNSTLNIDDINILAINNTNLSNFINSKTIINSSNSYTIDESNSLVGTSITASSGDDTIIGSNFKDSIKTYSGNDNIDSKDGDDYIDAGAGNDMLIGGKGDDTLVGGSGNDTYIFGKDFGNDTIDNYDISKFRNDTIEFKDSITKDDLIFLQNGDDLMIYLKDENYSSLNDIKNLKNSIKVKNFYKMQGDLAASSIDLIKFEDKTTLNKFDISSLALKNVTKDSKKLSVVTNHNYKINTTSSSNLIVSTLGGDDDITLGGTNHLVSLGSGNDTITILDGNSKVYTGNGNDKIVLNGGNNYADAGGENDTIISGSGNDTLIGGSGDDAYIFNKEFGKDIIINTKSINTEKDIIKFSDGISKEDLIFKQDKFDLVIYLKDENYSNLNELNNLRNNIIVKNFYTLNGNEAKNIIDSIEFTNGKKLNIKAINELALLNATNDSEYLSVTTDDDYVIDALNGNDTITTLGGDDVIKAGDGNNIIKTNLGDDIIITGNGNNTIDAGSGNDIIKAGSGNDTITGGGGSDVYEFKKDYGKDIIISSGNLAIDKDIIRFVDETTANDLEFHKKDSSLIISKNIENAIEIKEFYKDNSNTISKIEFNDGSSLSLKDIINKTLLFVSDLDDDIKVITDDDYTIDALGGDDTITTLGGDDHIDGNDGNDKIYSGSGDDTLIGGSGDDLLVAGAGRDTLIGGSGDDILKGGSGNDTYKFDKNYGKDIIIDNEGNDTIEFIDSSIDLTFTQLPNRDLLISDNLNTITVKEFFKLDENNNRLSSINSIKYKGQKLNLKEITDLCLKNTSDKDDDLVVITDDSYTVNLNGGDDKITMLGGDDYIDAGKGDDIIKAGFGDDTIMPGSGNDTIYSGKGKNKIIFKPNFEHDVLYANELDEVVFKNISANSLDFIYDPNSKDLIINHNLDSLTIKNFGSKNSSIDKIVFDNEKALDKKAIIELASIVSSDDTLLLNESGKFNAGMGDDRYIITDQTGKVTINDSFELYGATKFSGNDTIEFRDVKTIQDLEFSIIKNNLIISVKENKNTFVTIENFLDKAIENLKLGGGKVFSLKDIIFDKFKPVISSSEFRLDEDSSIDASIIAFDPLNTKLTYEVVNTPTDAKFTLDDNKFTFTPNENFNGVNTIFIKVSNEYGISSFKEIKFIINSTNDAPKFNSNTKTLYDLKDIREINGSVYANDEDGDNLTYSIKSINGIDATLSMNSDFILDSKTGEFKYSLKDKFIGLEKVEIQVSDDSNASDTVVLNFNSYISTPTILTNSISLYEDENFSKKISISNPSNSKLTYELIASNKNIEYQLSGDKLFINPSKDYHGKDSITLKVTNEYGLSDTKDIAIDVKPVNDAPQFTSLNTSFRLFNELSFTSTLTASDVDGDILFFNVENTPKFGKFEVDDNGSFTYTPNKGYLGNDTVIVKVSDKEGLSDTLTINFNVDASSPIIKTTSIVLDEDTSLSKTIDVDNLSNSNLTYEIVNSSNNLQSLNIQDGILSFTPNLNYHGKDSITLKVTNEYGLSDTKEIAIDVKPVNDAPTLSLKSQTYTLRNINKTVSSIGASDVDGDDLTYKVISNPNNSNINIDKNGNFTYTANKYFLGYDKILVEISDSSLCTTKELIFNNLGYKIDNSDTDLVINKNQSISSTIDLTNFDKDDIEFSKDKDNLIVSIKESNITLEDYFTKNHSIKEIKFSDGFIDISNDNLIEPSKKWYQINSKARLNKKGIIVSNLDNASLIGSGDSDTIISLNKNAKISSSGGKSDFIYAKNDNNIISSGEGNDTIIAKGDNNQIYSYKGDDYIVAGLSAYINSGFGNDDVTMLGNNSRAYLGSGNDKAIINSSNSITYAGNGNDTITSNGNNNTLIGGNNNDTYIIDKNATNTIIKDKELINLIDGGIDTLIIKDTKKENIRFKFDGLFNKDLTINYKTNSSDEIKT
ncbi:tandem-95 repeat protein, partial [Campylobacter sp. FMV-PI01]